MATINIANLTASLGAYNRKVMPILIREMLLGLNIADRFQIMDDVKDQLPLPNLTMGSLIKPANNTVFSPANNALNFGARILQVRRWKADLLLDPSIFEKTWLAYYQPKGSGTQLQNIPFEQYLMAQIIKEVQQELRLQALYTGVYNAAGTTPVDVMDGLLTLITTEITAGNIAPVTTGVITSANVTASLLKVYDNLGEAYKMMPLQVVVNPQIFEWYIRLYNPIVNPSLVATDTQAMSNVPMLNEFPLYGTNAVLKREPGFGASQRIVATPKNNMIYGTDTMGEENNIRFQEFDRTIKMFIDAKSGVQLSEIHSRALAVNEQA